MKYLIVLIFLIATSKAFGFVRHFDRAAVGDRTYSSTASLVFEVNSTSAVSLPCPPMTQVERDLITNIATGSCVYDTTDNKLNTYNGATWVTGGGVSDLGDLGDVDMTATAEWAMLTYSATDDGMILTTDPTMQSITIGASLESSSIFQVDSITKGSIPCPKMTQAERDAIVGATNGLCVYNMDTHKLNTYNSFKSLWVAAGDAGTTFEINQVGHGYAPGLSFIPVYSASGEWVTAKADDTDTLGTHLIINVIDADNFTVASSGRFEITAHGLTEGFHYVSAGASGTLTSVEPPLSNPIVYVEDANYLHVLPWRASESTGTAADSHTTNTPTDVLTINWNDGRSHTIDLENVTDEVTLTLVNPRVGDRHWLKLVQGPNQAQIRWPESVYWPGGNVITVSASEDKIDIVDLRYDGINYYAVFNQAYASAYLNDYSTIFDGVDEYAEVSNITKYQFNKDDAFSISVWYKTNTNLSAKVIAGNRDESADLRGWAFNISSADQLTFVLVSTNAGNRLAVSTTASIPIDGNWHHAVATYDGGEDASGVTLYIDNTPYGTATNDNSLSAVTTNSTGLKIGTWGNLRAPFEGNLDEITIWNKELSSSEVSELYGNAEPVRPTNASCSCNLIGWWRMGDGDTFNVLTDQSGNGGNATMVNMEFGDFVQDVPGE